MVVINPTYESLREWIETIPDRFVQEGKVIYDARNQIRLITAPDGTELCVKRFHTPHGFNRWIYTHLREPKAERAYRNALRLTEQGIGTPEPIACLMDIRHGLLYESYLITRSSRLTRNFYEFRHHPLAGHEGIVRSFAQWTAAMHEKGILHKDYSPGNILFDILPDGSVAFEIVDINRMRFDHAVGMRCACRNFCRLWGKEDFFLLLAQEYAHARGWDEQRCIRFTLRYWRRFWRFRT